MMTTINIEGNLTQGKLVKQTIKFAINTVRTYINNYSLMYEPIVEKNKIKLCLKVKGAEIIYKLCW